MQYKINHSRLFITLKEIFSMAMVITVIRTPTQTVNAKLHAAWIMP